jgi:hypothetical protein
VQDAEELAVWLSEHVLPQGHPDEHVNAAAYQRLQIWASSRRHRIA